VVLLTTAHRGRRSVMPMSWHTMMEFEPPLVGCVISNANFSFGLLRASRQCVLNIPTWTSSHPPSAAAAAAAATSTSSAPSA